MELRTYWSVVWRWKWLVLAVALVTFVATMGVQSIEPTLYRTTVRLALNPNLPMTPGDYSPAMHQYYEYVSAEYLNDDVMKVVEGSSFHSAAHERASALLGRPVRGAIEPKKAHKLMLFNITTDDPEQAQALGAAISELLTDPQTEYFKLFVSYSPTITLVDEPLVEAATAPSRALLFLMLRAALGLIAGLGLAFLLEYLDDTVRTAREAEAVTGLPVLGEIPKRGASEKARSATGSASSAPKTQVA
jgi:capsular polysaccharide biosynthesis protein